MQTGGNANAGAGFDLFLPYGPFDFSSSGFLLSPLSGPARAVLELRSIPGYRTRLETTDAIESGIWTMDQTVTPPTSITALTSSGATSTGAALFPRHRTESRSGSRQPFLPQSALL